MIEVRGGYNVIGDSSQNAGATRSPWKQKLGEALGVYHALGLFGVQVGFVDAAADREMVH